MAKGRERSSRRRSPAELSGGDEARTLEAGRILTRTVVYRRIPFAERQRLDPELLKASSNRAALEALWRKERLHERFGIGLPALRTYVRRLEECVRPALGAQIVAALLGSLPREYRRRVMEGSAVLLLSRMVAALSLQTSEPLSASELARLGGILRGLRSTRCGVARRVSETSRRGSTETMSPDRLAQAVRAIYGLDWPPRDRALLSDAPSSAKSAETSPTV